MLNCIRAWEDLAIYPMEFLIQLQNLFFGIDKKYNQTQEDANSNSQDGTSIDNNNKQYKQQQPLIPFTTATAAGRTR